MKNMKRENLLEKLRKEGRFVENPCNGKGICGKCKVKILSGDAGEVDGGLAAAAQLEGGVTQHNQLEGAGILPRVGRIVGKAPGRGGAGQPLHAADDGVVKLH